MIIKPLFTCIALSLACAFTSAVNAKEALKASQAVNQNTIPSSIFRIDPAKIERLSEVKATLGISGIADHDVKAEYGKELNAEFAERVKTKLATLKDIQEKYAFLMAINSVFKIDFLQINRNFPFNWTANEKQFLDAVYTAYLSLVFNDTKGKSQAEIEYVIKELERKAPFKLYDADLKKVEAYLKK